MTRIFEAGSLLLARIWISTIEVALYHIDRGVLRALVGDMDNAHDVGVVGHCWCGGRNGFIPYAAGVMVDILGTTCGSSGGPRRNLA